jgi:hypothetical protein
LDLVNFFVNLSKENIGVRMTILKINEDEMHVRSKMLLSGLEVMTIINSIKGLGSKVFIKVNELAVFLSFFNII